MSPIKNRRALACASFEKSAVGAARSKKWYGSQRDIRRPA